MSAPADLPFDLNALPPAVREAFAAMQAKEPGRLYIVDRLEVGWTSPSEQVSMGFEESNGNLYPFSLADKLRASGVAVDLEIYRGVTHEFIKMGRAVPEALKAHADAALALRQAFAME